MSKFDKLYHPTPHLVQSMLDKLAALFPKGITEGPEGTDELVKLMVTSKVETSLIASTQGTVALQRFKKKI